MYITSYKFYTNLFRWDLLPSLRDKTVQRERVTGQQPQLPRPGQAGADLTRLLGLILTQGLGVESGHRSERREREWRKEKTISEHRCVPELGPLDALWLLPLGTSQESHQRQPQLPFCRQGPGHPSADWSPLPLEAAF